MSPYVQKQLTLIILPEPPKISTSSMFPLLLLLLLKIPTSIPNRTPPKLKKKDNIPIPTIYLPFKLPTFPPPTTSFEPSNVLNGDEPCFVVAVVAVVVVFVLLLVVVC